MAADTSGRRRNRRRQRTPSKGRPLRQLLRLTDRRAQMLGVVVTAAATIAVAAINNSGAPEATPPTPSTTAPTSAAPANPTRTVDGTRSAKARPAHPASARPSPPSPPTVPAMPATSPTATPLAVPSEHTIESGRRSLEVHVGHGPQPHLQVEGKGWPIYLDVTCYLDEAEAGDFTTSASGTFAGPLHFQDRYPDGIPDGEYAVACSNQTGNVHFRAVFSVPAP